MQSDDIAALGVFVAMVGATLAMGGPWLSRRSARAKQRLDILQESLKHPQLDAETRNRILAVLAKEQQSSLFSKLTSGAFWQRIFFGGGWLMFVFCGGMACLSWMGFINRFVFNYALVWSLVGLAVASLPFAMRELSTRQGRVAE